MSFKKIEESLYLSNVFPNYVFDKRIFRSIIIVIVLMALYSLHVDGTVVEQIECINVGYSHEYEVYCSEVGQVHGDEVSHLREYFGGYVLLLVLAGFHLNHFLHNKKWRDS